LGQQADYVASEFLVEHGIVALSNVPVLIDGAAWGVDGEGGGIRRERAGGEAVCGVAC